MASSAKNGEWGNFGEDHKPIGSGAPPTVGLLTRIMRGRSYKKFEIAVALGKTGGQGGKDEGRKTQPEERSASARKAALASWERLKKTTEKKRKQRHD